MLDFLFFKKNKTFFRSLFRSGDEKIRSASRRYVEPHEILLDSLAEKKERDLVLSEKKFEVPLLRKIIQIFFVFCFFLLLFLLFKTSQLQIAQGENFVRLAERNKFIVQQIQAERGVIYDRNLEQLVFNKSNFDLFYQKKNFPEDEGEKERILQKVSEIIQEDVKEKINDLAADQILIKSGLSHRELILFEARTINELPGFRVEISAAREYKEGEVFAHIIGYTGKIKKEEFEAAAQFYSINDYVGREGIENYYERYLRKNPGTLRIERDAFGNLISAEALSSPESGKSLVLYLDAGLQRKIKEELEKKYKELGAKGAVAIAIEPKTGGILSMISLPGFDNNLFEKGADSTELRNLLDNLNGLNPLLNRAFAGKYLIGSTIKPLIAAAALEEGVVSPGKQIYSAGYIEVPHQYDPEIVYRYNDWTIHGWVDVKKAIAQSSNVYFYVIGGGYKDQKGLGPTKIKEYLELFGWGEKTGIDLPGEIAGLVPGPEWKRNVLGEGWWDGDTYYLSIGQQYIQITPLEVAIAFSAIANGGTLFQPKIVKEVVDTSLSGQVIEVFPSEIIRQDFISEKSLTVVREGMRQAVTGENSPQASATILNSLPIKVAAKTGTAELGGDRYNNWVTVFAPYDDPEIVLTIMMENVKGVQAAVLPVAKEILEWYFQEK
jgi:penicillin-binding protein 2